MRNIILVLWQNTKAIFVSSYFCCVKFPSKLQKFNVDMFLGVATNKNTHQPLLGVHPFQGVLREHCAAHVNLLWHRLLQLQTQHKFEKLFKHREITMEITTKNFMQIYYKTAFQLVFYFVMTTNFKWSLLF